jgi:CRISPR/Cas system-associated endoribonuclease Cas2
MAVYLISYDIAEKDNFEYEGLWAELERIKAVRILYSEWVLAHSSTSCTEIYNVIAKKVQGKDKLLVVQLAESAIWDKLMISDQVFTNIMAKA